LNSLSEISSNLAVSLIFLFAGKTAQRAQPPSCEFRIAREERPVTADTALRLGKSKIGAAFWMNIQARFDFRNGRKRNRAADQEDCVLRSGVRAMQIARAGYLAAVSLLRETTFAASG
jgi:hypothetical protein